MLTNNKYITLYNKKMFGRNALWLRTGIACVNIFRTLKTAVGDKSLNSADEIIIRIPAEAYADGKSYIDSRTFKGYSVDELSNYYTLQKGDLIVEGIVTDEIQNSSELMQKYDVMTVLSITDNLSVSAYSSHIKVVCA